MDESVSPEREASMKASPSFARVSTMELDRDGTITVTFDDGRQVTASRGQGSFVPSGSLSSCTYRPQSSQLRLRTTRGDDIVVDLPSPWNMAPILGRPTIYLDQNHWSALTNVLHAPEKRVDEGERQAALRLIGLARDRKVILPMSSAHLAETTKQQDGEQRYRRALTIAQLSAGWQLRDPLDLRRFEIRRALARRYRQFCLIPPAAVTLEPNAVHSGRERESWSAATDLPPDAEWAIHCLSHIGGTLDTMLDAEHIPVTVNAGWSAGLQEFATFLQSSPSSKELKRKRTHLKFIADLGRELPEEAYHAGTTPEQMSDWTLNHSERDLLEMPTLGLFREVLHEKLSDPQLRWKDNDLTDMTYLTAAAGYCDHVVGERSHVSHINNSLRRMGRPNKTHRSLRALLEVL